MIYRHPVYAVTEPMPGNYGWFDTALAGLLGYAPIPDEQGRPQPMLRSRWGGTALTKIQGQDVCTYSKGMYEMEVAWEVRRDGEPVWLDTDRRNWTKAQTRLFANKPGRLVRYIFDVPICRFFVEQWFPPEIACRDWEIHRFEWDEQSGTRIDVTGPMPTHGMYGSILKLEEENGDILYPNEGKSLDEVKRALWLREQDPDLAKFSWAEPPPVWLVNQRLESYYKETKRQEELEDAEAQAQIEDVIRTTLSNRATSLPSYRPDGSLIYLAK